jgi:hypothetical protein
MDYKLLRGIAFIVFFISIFGFNLSVLYTTITFIPFTLFFVIFVIFISFYIKNFFINVLITIVAFPCVYFLLIFDFWFYIQRACPGGWNEDGKCDK